MNEPDINSKLDLLEFLDQETVRAYDIALRKIQDPKISAELKRFRDEHDQHVSDLSNTARAGAKAPTDQMRHFIDEHLAVVQDAGSEQQILEGLMLLEVSNLAEARRIVQIGATDEASQAIQRFFNDEQRHCAWFRNHVPIMFGISHESEGARAAEGTWTISETLIMQKLSELRYMDKMTASFFDMAIGKVGDTSLQQQFAMFKSDHQRHVDTIDQLLNDLGTSPELPIQELQQYMDEIQVLIDAAKDEQSVLEAMLVAERANVSQYASAARADMPDDVVRVLVAHRDDEQHHVNFIEERMPVPAGPRSNPTAGDIGGTNQ